MGILTHLTGLRIYLDTNCFIYAVEDHPLGRNLVAPILSILDEGTAQGFTSELALAEALVVPMREKKAEAVAAYKDLIRSRAGLTVIPIVRSILIRAADLRSTSSLKLPDAIHLASAEAANADVFVTNDKQLAGVRSLQSLILSEVE